MTEFSSHCASPEPFRDFVRNRSWAGAILQACPRWSPTIFVYPSGRLSRKCAIISYVWHASPSRSSTTATFESSDSWALCCSWNWSESPSRQRTSVHWHRFCTSAPEVSASNWERRKLITRLREAGKLALLRQTSGQREARLDVQHGQVASALLGSSNNYA